jgi:hypothetical protein
MDGLTLLSEAVAAGLTVRVDGDRLVIRGPKAADAMARRLLEHKPEVLAALGRFGLSSTELPKPDESPFPGWVRRPDVAGRMGWEPPDLPESRRWWARVQFEDLPTLAAYFPGSVHRPEDGPCQWCGRREWWQSQAWPDVLRCGRCSPPAPGVAVEWLRRPEAGPAGKSVAQAAGCCVPAESVDA